MTTVLPTDAAELVSFCNLALRPSDLPRPQGRSGGGSGSGAWIGSLRRIVQELDANPNKARVYSFGRTLADLLTKLDALQLEASDGSAELHELANLPIDALRALEECMDLPFPEQRLLAIDAELEQLLVQVDRIDEVKAIALSDGEMQVAEEQFHLKAAHLERLLALALEKHGLLAKTEQETRLFAATDGVRERALAATAALRNGRRRTREAAEADIRRLDAAVDRARASVATGPSAAATAEGGMDISNDAWFADNTAKREDCWRRIQELERQFQQLCQDRADEMGRRVKRSNQSAAQAERLREFERQADQHRQRLVQLQRGCDAFVAAAQVVEDMVAESCLAVKARTEKTLRFKDETLLGIERQVLLFYRRLYKCLGQLKYKREKRIDEIDRQIRANHIQLELCIETFDPVAKKYANTKKDCYRLRADTEEDIAALITRMDRATALFQPIGALLTSKGVDWVDPRYEVEEGNLARRSLMVEYRAHLATPEEARIAAEREEIQTRRLLLSSSSNSRPTTPSSSSSPSAPLRIADS